MVLTGALGTGKTTLLSKLVPEGLPGITTWAEPYKSVFMKENRETTAVKIASYDDAIQGTNLKMVLDEDALCAFGIPALRRCIQSESAWVHPWEIRDTVLSEQDEPH